MPVGPPHRDHKEGKTSGVKLDGTGATPKEQTYKEQKVFKSGHDEKHQSGATVKETQVVKKSSHEQREKIHKEDKVHR